MEVVTDPAWDIIEMLKRRDIWPENLDEETEQELHDVMVNILGEA